MACLRQIRRSSNLGPSSPIHRPRQLGAADLVLPVINIPGDSKAVI